MNHKLENATAIIFNYLSKTYTVNYKWTETVEVNIAHTVYTGAMNKSRKLRNVRTTTRTHERSENVAVSEQVARAIGRAFRNADRLGSVERLENETIQNLGGA